MYLLPKRLFVIDFENSFMCPMYAFRLDNKFSVLRISFSLSMHISCR